MTTTGSSYDNTVAGRVNEILKERFALADRSSDPAETWPWPDLDHTSAAALLAECLSPAEHRALEPFGQGDFCLAFRSGSQVIRVARHFAAAAALSREACVLAAVAGTLPLPVPVPWYYPSNSNGCPPFSVHTEITGSALTPGEWMRMAPKKREQAAADLAEFMRVLHGLPVDPENTCGLVQLHSAVYARNLREPASEVLYTLLDREERQMLDASLAQWSSSGEGASPALLHCDIAPGHLLYDRSTERLAGVIDFGDIALGEPARDFIYIAEDFGPVILADVLKHYSCGGAPLLLSDIRKWYLLETIAWTLDRIAEQRNAEVSEGLEEITRTLAGRNG